MERGTEGQRLGRIAPAVAVAALAMALALAAPSSEAARPASRLAAPAGRESAGRFHCQHPGAKFTCYGPRQLRRAYDFKPLLKRGLDGSGETIVVIDAFQDPTLSSDLSSFDSAFGIPAPPSLEVIAPEGITPFEPASAEQVGWAGEIALDVEWAHAIAPGARLVLALAPSNSEADLLAAQRYVIQHELGDVVSMSYVETEECASPALLEEEHALFKEGVEAGMTFVAGSGDEGATEFNCEETALLPTPAVAIPATDPNVTAVGGTALSANLKRGLYEGESVWDEPLEGAGGGGFSVLYPAPKYQQGVAAIGSQRGVPDVAYSAAEHGGTIVAFGSTGEPGSIFYIFSGTSLGTPQWAALAAIADQEAHSRLGNINPALYALGGGPAAGTYFHDVTAGENGFAGVAGFAAAPGWDAASGWGSPIAAALVPALAASGPGGAELARPLAPARARRHAPGAGARPLGAR